MFRIILIGVQWDDEGRGKVTGLIGTRIDYVVRFNGGNNAGHSVMVSDEPYALHLLSSGIINPNLAPAIGDGVAIGPEVPFEEIDGLESCGTDCSHLKVGEAAYITVPYHRILGKMTERFLDEHKTGTTDRGIGPAYANKINRVGVRMCDLPDTDHLHDEVEASLHQRNQMLVKLHNRRPIDVGQTTEEPLKSGEYLKPYVVSTGLILNEALDEGKTISFEGAQAIMLDMDHGTYPFVTSSNPTAGGAHTGTGVGPTRITRVVGVSKAHIIRTDEGPSPTELLNESGEWLRQQGHELDVTTDHLRRCDWFDAVINRHVSQANGLIDIVFTELGVLAGLKEISIYITYDMGGECHDDMPTNQAALVTVKPIYETMPDWDENISNCHSLDELPATRQAYAKRLEELSGYRISAIGTGPQRDHVIQINSLVD